LKKERRKQRNFLFIFFLVFFSVLGRKGIGHEKRTFIFFLLIFSPFFFQRSEEKTGNEVRFFFFLFPLSFTEKGNMDKKELITLMFSATFLNQKETGTKSFRFFYSPLQTTF
jgi:hypothetical protein